MGSELGWRYGSWSGAEELPSSPTRRDVHPNRPAGQLQSSPGFLSPPPPTYLSPSLWKLESPFLPSSPESRMKGVLPPTPCPGPPHLFLKGLCLSMDAAPQPTHSPVSPSHVHTGLTLPHQPPSSPSSPCQPSFLRELSAPHPQSLCTPHPLIPMLPCLQH